MTDYFVLNHWPLKFIRKPRYNARTPDANSNSALIRSTSTSFSTAHIESLSVRRKIATTNIFLIKFTSTRFSVYFSNFTAERAMEPTAPKYLSIAVQSCSNGVYWNMLAFQSAVFQSCRITTTVTLFCHHMWLMNRSIYQHCLKFD